jgi:glyoxylase-like metal-dependent hydrolase (beta-lactamase superfamily II)
VAPGYDPRMTSGASERRWTEVGDRVFVRRYRFYDQDIVAVLGRTSDEALVVDTRSTVAQAREILDDLAELGSPRVVIVVNTHGHYDHVFGNQAFRPAVIWGHERCRSMMERTGEQQRASILAEVPKLADELAEVVLEPPDRVFTDGATLDLAGREVRLSYLGRGHTDNDIVVSIPDADVLGAGDLLENGNPPYFGDGYPMDWPATVDRLLALTGPSTVVVPGHGDHAGRTFVEQSAREIGAIAALARRVEARELDLEAAIAAAPYPADASREPIERALAQLRGALDPAAA